MQNDSIATVSTNTYWESISYVFDENGVIVDSIVTPINGTIAITDLIYYKRYAMSFQIMSFVTPYGAYLDLGIDGKTWYFDITDYSPVLKGNKQITTTNILSDPKSKGGTFVFKTSFPKTKALPNSAMINKINK